MNDIRSKKAQLTKEVCVHPRGGCDPFSGLQTWTTSRKTANKNPKEIYVTGGH